MSFVALRHLLVATAPLLLLVIALFALLGYEFGRRDVVLVLVYCAFLGISLLAAAYYSRINPRPGHREVERLVGVLLSLPLVGRLPLARRIAVLNAAGLAWYTLLSRRLWRLEIRIYAIVIGLAALLVWLEVATRLVFVFLLLVVFGLSYVGVSVATLVAYRRRLPDFQRGLRSFRLLAHALIAILLAILGRSWSLRIDDEVRSWFAVVFTVVAFAILWWLRPGNEARHPTRVALFAGSVLLPLTLAWCVTSLALLPSWTQAVIAVWWGHDHDPYDKQLEARRRHHSVPVAVALSGGGYRAAAVHTGVLAALDDAGIAIRYLSTVSGGSIVGANYALGMAPGVFAERLRSNRPGLAADLFNVVTVGIDLLHKELTRTDVFGWHLRRVYFHWHTMGETGPPTLIVNTTDYASGRRAAFWPYVSRSWPLAPTVAASGAFPLAFAPITIGGSRYIDGGVVENLGLDGLALFLDTHRPGSAIEVPTPEVLIISDVSKLPDRLAGTAKVWALAAAWRALDLSYESVHRYLYDRYTERRYAPDDPGPLKQPFEVEAESLWQGQGRKGKVCVFVLAPTTRAESQRFGGAQAKIQRVAALPTLRELEPDEVTLAVWAGRTITEAYIDAISDRARGGCARLSPRR